MDVELNRAVLALMNDEHFRMTGDQARRAATLVLNASLPSAQPSDVMKAVMNEVKKATKKFPTWPTDPLHAVAVLGEEFGELTKAALQHVYEPHKSTADDVRTEAIQTAAMALRFLMSLEAYQYTKGRQHEQQ